MVNVWSVSDTIHVISGKQLIKLGFNYVIYVLQREKGRNQGGARLEASFISD